MQRRVQPENGTIARVLLVARRETARKSATRSTRASRGFFLVQEPECQAHVRLRLQLLGLADHLSDGSCEARAQAVRASSASGPASADLPGRRAVVRWKSD